MLQKQSMLKSLFAVLTAMILTAPAFAGGLSCSSEHQSRKSV